MKNVMYDLPIMETSVMAGEMLRRIQHLINLRKMPDNQRSFNTPYEDFTHQHMAGFNSVVVDALAVPAGVSVHNLKREGLLPMSWKHLPTAFQDEKTTILQLQWPFQLEHLRIIDHENNISGLDLTRLNSDNQQATDPHVDLLLPFQGTKNTKFWNDTTDVCGYTVACMIKDQFGDYRTVSVKQDPDDSSDVFGEKLKLRMAAEIPSDKKVNKLHVKLSCSKVNQKIKSYYFSLWRAQ